MLRSFHTGLSLSHAPRSCLSNTTRHLYIEIDGVCLYKAWPILTPSSLPFSFFHSLTLYTLWPSKQVGVSFFLPAVILLIFLRPLANDAAATTKWSMPRATKRRMGEEDEDDNNMIAYEVK